MPFDKGKSGNPAGRQPGVSNRTTRQMREAARTAIAPEELCQLWATWAREGNMKASQLLAMYGYGLPQPGGDVDRMDDLEADGLVAVRVVANELP